MRMAGTGYSKDFHVLFADKCEMAYLLGTIDFSGVSQDADGHAVGKHLGVYFAIVNFNSHQKKETHLTVPEKCLSL